MALTKIEKNSLITALREAEADGRLGIIQLIDSALDIFFNEAGIDTAVCVGQTYTAATDSYDSPAEVDIAAMEYADNATAQAAVVSSVAGSYTVIPLHSGYLMSEGFDDFITYNTHDSSTASAGWNCATATTDAYLRIGFDYGVKHAIRRMQLYTDGVHGGDYQIDYSDDDSTWTTAVASWTPSGGVGWNTQAVNHGAHRFWRIVLTNTPADSVNITEVKFEVEDLQCFTTDDTDIVHTGTYALEIEAASGSSAADTLTADLSAASPDLTGVDEAYVWVRASRTGTNFKVGLTNDVGGTPVVTEANAVITTANTWTRVAIDFSAVVDGDKDDIDNIIITILDDSADNIIYVDDFVGSGEMQVFSKEYTPSSAPSTISGIILTEDVDTPTVNTDFYVQVSRDGGTTYSTATLTYEGLANFSPDSTPTDLKVFSFSEDVTDQPSGTDIRYALISKNGERLKFHGAALSWA